MKPNQQLLLALDRVRTGANAHDMGEFTSQYQYACEKDRANAAAAWEAAFTAFLSGRVTPLRKAVATIRYGDSPPAYPNKNWWNEGE